jgi:DNA-binding winged helix-turn-helix (wHTH) protein/tetratricopeptide (TPR) repeat protein
MATGSESITSFGAFEIDRRSGELRKGGVRVRLASQPFQVLLALLDRAGQVVTRDELQRRIWPADTFVDFDRGLNKAVNRLREALGDTADSPRFIETIPKRGYRFIAPVQQRDAGSERATDVPASPDVADPLSAEGSGDRISESSSVQRERPRPVRVWMAGAAVVLLGIAAVGYTLLAGGPRAIDEPARIVLADFENETGDPAFDHTVAQALAVDLQQSPVVQIVSDHEVRRTLALMRQPADRPLTIPIAHDVCRRTGGFAVLGGTLSLVGAEYVIGLEALQCQTGEVLTRRQLKASRKEGVLDAIDTAAADIRRTLGEASDSIRRFDSRVHRMLTTTSLDAFEAYTAGERNVLRQGGWSAVPFFNRSIELDPEFAYAHAALGLILGTFGEVDASRLHTEKAYQLRDRVSEWERLFITAQYHDRVTGDLDQMLTTGEMWVATYPYDRTARNRLAAAFNQLGQSQRAIDELEKARGIGRDHPLDVDAWAVTALRLDRAREALPVVQRLLEQTPDRVPLRRTVYRLHFAAGDPGAMAAQVDWASHTPRAEALLAEQAATDAYYGRVDRSRSSMQRAVDGALRNDFKGNAAVWTALNAVREALLGNIEEARAQARAAVTLEDSADSRALAAVALARAGDLDAARQLADKMSAERPRGTLVQNYWMPVIRAQADLHGGGAEAAIESLRAAEPYELSDTRLPLLPAYVRGEAYLRTRDGRRAAAEFQKLLQHHGAVGNSLLGPLSRIGLARALALAGDPSGAKTQYETFFELWRDADAQIPLMRQARAEYQQIRSQ